MSAHAINIAIRSKSGIEWHCFKSKHWFHDSSYSWQKSEYKVKYRLEVPVLRNIETTSERKKEKSARDRKAKKPCEEPIDSSRLDRILVNVYYARLFAGEKNCKIIIFFESITLRDIMTMCHAIAQHQIIHKYSHFSSGCVVHLIDGTIYCKLTTAFGRMSCRKQQAQSTYKRSVFYSILWFWFLWPLYSFCHFYFFALAQLIIRIMFFFSPREPDLVCM